MSSNQSPDYHSSKTLDCILKDVGMRSFENENQQAMRMRAAGVLIGHFREAASALTDPIVAVETATSAADIAVSVEHALACAGELDSSHIFVSAEGSDITLAGWVPSEDEISHSSAIAANVNGVNVVHNELSRAL